MGFLASFLAYPVIVGFAAAASLVIASSQLKPAMSIAGTKGNFIHNMSVFGKINQAVPGAIIMTLFGLIFLLLLKYIPRKYPTFKILIKLPGFLV